MSALELPSRRITLAILTEDDAELVRDYMLENREHLEPWEPARTEEGMLHEDLVHPAPAGQVRLAHCLRPAVVLRARPPQKPALASDGEPLVSRFHHRLARLHAPREPAAIQPVPLHLEPTDLLIPPRHPAPLVGATSVTPAKRVFRHGSI